MAQNCNPISGVTPPAPTVGRVGGVRRNGKPRLGRGGNWKLWTPEEDLKLTEVCQSEVNTWKSGRVTVAWKQVVEKYNSTAKYKRTIDSLSNRWQELKRGLGKATESRPSVEPLDQLVTKEKEKERSVLPETGDSSWIPVHTRSPTRDNLDESSSTSDDSFHSCVEALETSVEGDPAVTTYGDFDQEQNETSDKLFEELKALPLECVLSKANLKLLNEAVDAPSEQLEKSFLSVFRKVSQQGTERRQILTCRANCKTIQQVDSLIKKYLFRPKTSKLEIDRLNALVYAGAVVVTNEYEYSRGLANHDKVSNESFLKNRNNTRCEISKQLGWLTDELRRRRANRAPTERQRRNLKKIVKLCKSRETEAIKVEIERLKQRLAVTKSEIDTKKAEIERSRLRNQFEREPSMKTIQKTRNQTHVERPDPISVNKFWRNILGKPRQPCLENKELSEVGSDLKSEYGQIDTSGLDKAEIMKWYNDVMRKVHSRKAPGPDAIKAIWWLKFPTARGALFRWVSAVLCGKTRITKRDATGRTVLLHKSGDPLEPQNYRPIACLNTYFKVLTAVIAKWLGKHVAKGKFFPEQQRAVKQGEEGCLQASLTDQAVSLAAHVRKESLCTAWIDFAKAFDSVPHLFITWLLYNLNVPPQLRAIVGRILSRSTTRLQMGKSLGDPINVRCGVMQGDSLSPYLFCVSVAAISKTLDKLPTVKFETTAGTVAINHQYFVDDLKIYARRPKGLKKALNAVETVVKAIGMKINEKKSAVAFNKYVASDDSRRVDLLQRYPEAENTGYKYLGIRQIFQVCDKTQLEELSGKVLAKVDEIAKSDLTFGQKRRLVNSVVMPSIRYVYLNMHWTRKNFDSLVATAKRLDTDIRRKLAEQSMRYEHSGRARLYLESDRGGLGLKSAEDTLKESRVSAALYLAMNDKLTEVSGLLNDLSESTRRGTSKRRIRTPLTDLAIVSIEAGVYIRCELKERTVTVQDKTYGNLSIVRKEITRLLRLHASGKRDEEWRQLDSAGVVTRIQGIDLRASSLWLAKGWMSGANVRNVVGLQEGCAHKSFVAYPFVEKCRLCKDGVLSSQHLLSNCQAITGSLYIDRHDSVALHLWNFFAKSYDVPEASRKTKPKVHTETSGVEMWWNARFEFETPICHRQPDLVIRDKTAKTIKVVEVSVAWCQNMARQVRIKTNRYTVNSEDLGKTELEEVIPRSANNFVRLLKLRYGGYKVEFHPIIVGACGEFLIETVESLEALCAGTTRRVRDELIENLSRSAALGSSRMLRRYCSTQP